MRAYDPRKAPNPREWLALDERSRISLVAEYHARTGETDGDTLMLHAGIHAAVETQLARKIPEVRHALANLRARGVSRHDAIHVVGRALAEHMSAHSRGDASAEAAEQAYFQRLAKL